MPTSTPYSWTKISRFAIGLGGTGLAARLMGTELELRNTY
jgi:hypothetical protein